MGRQGGLRDRFYREISAPDTILDDEYDEIHYSHFGRNVCEHFEILETILKLP